VKQNDQKFFSFLGLFSFTLSFVVCGSLISGCGSSFDTNATGSILSGSVLPLRGLLAQREEVRNPFAFSVARHAEASACAADSVTVRIYSVLADGSRSATPLYTTTLDADANYRIPSPISKGIRIDSNGGVQYAVEVQGCISGALFSRPLDGYRNQNITAGSTLVASILDLDATKATKLVDAGPELKNFLGELETLSGSSANMGTIYVALNSDTALSSEFSSLFGFSPAALLNSAPRVLSLTFPTQLHEHQTTGFFVASTHWDPNYDQVYLWKKDGAAVSTAASYNWYPNANANGPHTIELFVGKNDGSGQIDLTKPYYTNSAVAEVSDDLPATPPSFALSGGGSLSASRSLSLAIQTGIALANCESFSSLAITEDQASPPWDPAAYSIACTQASTQLESYTLQGAGDGLKTLRLWAKDSQGNLSATPALLLVTLDTTPPSAPAFTTASATTSGSAFAVAGTCASDVTQVQLKIDGAVQTTVTCSGNAFSGSVTSTTDGAHSLTARAVDAAGNLSTAESAAITWSRDTSAPGAPAIALTSANPTNSTAATLTVSDCTDRAKIYLSETSAAPSLTAPEWQTCTTAAGAILATLSAGDGTKTLYAFAKDAAENLSPSSSLTVDLDQTAPGAPAAVFAANSGVSLAQATGAATLTIGSCADRAKILVRESGTAPLPSDPGWQTCATTAGAIATSVASEGTHSLRVWAMDAASNVSASSTALSLIYDQTPPVVADVTINGGAAFTGTPLLSVNVTVTDSFTAPTAVRVAEADLVTHDCQSQYADDSWQTYSAPGTPQTFSYTASSGDGSKIMCAWAKDSVGNISAITSPTTGTAGVNMQSISLSVGNPPQVTSFAVSNGTAGTNFGTTTFAAGNIVKIDYAATDVEGLDNNPISLSYTTNNTLWKDVVTGGDVTTPSNVTWMGGLSGNPTSTSGTYATFTAPTAGYFRVRIAVRDLAGNSSVAVLSDSLNTPNWSIYAGSTDRGVGGNALTAAFSDYDAMMEKFTVDPKTGDLYIVDHAFGIKKVDVRTGTVSTFLDYGGTNLATSGTLTSASRINTYELSIRFDPSGFLYASVYLGATNGALIYRIDPATGAYTLYIGGGTVYDATATPSTAYALAGMMAFDESNSLYYLTACSWGASPNPMRLMKMTQNSDGTPGSISVVAGNCATSAPSGAGPTDPLISPFAYARYTIGTLEVWNNGQDIYYDLYGQPTRKILNGQNYSSNLTVSNGGTIVHDPKNGKLYVANGSVSEVTPNLSGADGDVATTWVSSSGTGACLTDGTDAANACVLAAMTAVVSPQGTLLFMDGPKVNSPRNFSIRYRDSAGKLRTLAGSLPFYGDGLDRHVIRGTISGIAYKKPTDPNQTAFPSGVYFMESSGMVMGRIDPTTGVTTVLAGTQQGLGTGVYPSGTAFNSSLSLQDSYQGGNGMPLAFDSTGLPWFRYHNAAASVDANGNLVARQTGTTQWDFATEGSNPKNAGLSISGGAANFSLKDLTLFLSGTYNTNNPRISAFDFSSNLIATVIGGSGTGFTADQAGSLTAATLSAGCQYQRGCFTQYDSTFDRLYFSEDANIRYVTTPTNPATSSLVTLFTQPAGATIRNFIFSPAGDQVFYLDSSGYFRCHDLSSGKSWCNDGWLGPGSGMNSIAYGANQFTWLDSGHLLISTYAGYIYEFTLPP
jgi:hypothetical protein